VYTYVQVPAELGVALTGPDAAQWLALMRMNDIGRARWTVSRCRRRLAECGRVELHAQTHLRLFIIGFRSASGMSCPASCSSLANSRRVLPSFAASCATMRAIASEALKLICTVFGARPLPCPIG
jgi:hypothetical protein